MEFTEQAQVYIQPVWAWFMEGLRVYGPEAPEIDWTRLWIQIGAISFVVALLMRAYAGILVFIIFAAILHELVNALIPMITQDAPFAWPPFGEGLWWQYCAFLLAAYFVTVTLWHLLKVGLGGGRR